MKAVIFDLDDTLYPEMDFVKSGFGAVARYLGSRHRLNEDSLLKQQLDILQANGRGEVFNILLHDLGIYKDETVKLLLYLYRSHRPAIRIYTDVMPTFERLRRNGIRLGMITDGMASVQRNKIKALFPENPFDAIICSDELGRDCWKPSIVPYTVAAELLQVSPREAVYVGDDASKDFLGANSLGMLTIQIQRQTRQDSEPDAMPEPARAIFKIGGLEEIFPVIGIAGEA